MYRFRTAYDQEFILYGQELTAKANITGNIVQWHEDPEDTSLYYSPIVDKKVTYDQETEQPGVETRNIRATAIHYLIPFNPEEANKLKPFANRSTNYYVHQEGGLVRAVDRYENRLAKPFEVLLAGSHSALNQEWEAQQEAQATTASAEEKAQPQQQQKVKK